MGSDLTASRTLSTTSQRSQVYVQVPSSSYPSDAKPESSSGGSLKENAPLQRPKMNSDGSMSTLTTASSHSRKRKLSDASETMTTRDEPTKSKAKKAKVSTADHAGGSDKAKATKSTKTRKPAELVTAEFPNGAFYCHQCNKKRDVSAGIQCTLKNTTSNVQNSRCKAKYCKACLKNRYGQDMDEIKTRGVEGYTRREKDKHVADEGFYFQCPKCNDECNCRMCRKAKGLEATGNLTLIARKAGKESAARLLAEDPATRGILPGKGQQVVQAKKPQRTKKSANDPVASSSTDVETKPARKPRVRAKAGDTTTTKPCVVKPKAPAEPKVLPNPTWSRIYTDLDLAMAETRMNIREFVLRFAAVMDIGKGNQEELEELETQTARRIRSDEDEDDEEVVSWVSDPCAKAIVVGLLSLLADTATAGDAMIVNDAVKDVRASGGNLTKIWAALASLRNELDSGQRKLTLDFPDPLPPPADATYHNTRSGKQAKDVEANIYVARSAQLVPVIASLIDSAVHTRTVRDELERGAAEEKEIAKETKETTSKENAKYRDSRASGTTAKGAVKAEREQHKQTLVDLENAHRLAAFTCLPRFSPLGQDHEGRVYYALTPGAAEREAALQLVAGKDGRVRSRRRGGLMEEDRQEMRRWSWFVAVWGKAPEGAIIRKDDEEDEDPETDRWWGFWQPEEVKNIADWIAIKCDLGEDVSRRVSEELENGTLARKDKGKGVDRHPSVVSTLASLDQSRGPSPLSDISSDEDADDKDGMYDGMCVDSEGRPVPTKRNLLELVQGLQEYADLLQWRIQRVEGSVPNSDIAGAVPAKSFYA